MFLTLALLLGAGPPALPPGDGATAPAAPANDGGAPVDTATSPEMPTFDEGSIPEELMEIARRVHDQPIGVRMAAISEPLMGRRYLNDAAGEGVPPDIDPPARYDAFDCLTFVEEVLALAMAGDPVSAPAIRRELRYANGAPVTYSNRNHFMLEEWIPHNIENGLLEDITADLGETHLVEKLVTPKTWSWWKKRSLFKVPDARLPTGTFRLQVMSPGAAAEAVDQIPDGALILTVRQSRDYVPIVVTHLGFKVPSATIPLMRHATRMGTEPRVRNDKLVWYLEHVRWYHRWPVEGITVLMPREIGPRMSALSPAELPAP
jgi:hypothetical protein